MENKKKEKKEKKENIVDIDRRRKLKGFLGIVIRVCDNCLSGSERRREENAKIGFDRFFFLCAIVNN